ncbi:MAG: ATP-binding protein [Pirellulales bacterium]|nr:ATP-binding protein [Pirellulales bacterium]
MLTLLIDTQAQRRAATAQRLSTLGAEVYQTATLDDAIPYSTEHSVDLAICCCPCAGELSDDPNSWAMLRAKVPWLVCQCDNRACTANTFELGCDDLLEDSTSDLQLRARLRVARQVTNLESRLAQAQKLESIGELAAGIAHEINTPIQYVGDNTRFVQEACQDIADVLRHCQDLLALSESDRQLGTQTKPLRESVENADLDYLIEEIPTAIEQSLEGITRVSNIVRAMKEFAHPGASEMTPIDLRRAIENTVMVARNEWKYVADLKTEFSPDLPILPCLPGELNQVVLNMIVNAAHSVAAAWGDSPETKGCITISARPVGPNMEIRIRDNGTGIPQEHLDRIFRPFFTTKAAGKGTGQGLAIAHSVIVEKHGGTIGVETELGRGTTFVIRLPLDQERSQPQCDEALIEA